MGHRHRLEDAHGGFHEVDLRQADLVCAQLSLPFTHGEFEASIDAALGAVKPGGAFVGRLFGHNDTWAGDGVASIDRVWIEDRFDGFSELHVEERE